MLVANASDYPLLNVFWTTLFIALWILWLGLLFTVFIDLFRRHELSGWAKAAWTLGLIALPYLGVLVYVALDGRGMAERRQREAGTARSSFDDRAPSIPSQAGPADQIAKAKQLLDSGAITTQEYENLKDKALT
jgi:hypothetical protein